MIPSRSKSVFSFFIVLLLLTLLLTPTALAKKPSEDYIPDPNITITNADDYNIRDFIISAYQGNEKLKKDKWDWIKRLDKDEFWLESKDDLKYDSEGKLKDPLTNIIFRVEPSLIQNYKKNTHNQYFSSSTYSLLSFDTFKSKNNITSETITPVYYDSNWEGFWDIFFSTTWGTFLEFQDFMRTPYAYDVTFSGIIDDLDPEINQVYDTSSDLFLPNKTEGSKVGARLKSKLLQFNFNYNEATINDVVRDNANGVASGGPTINSNCGADGGSCLHLNGSQYITTDLSVQDFHQPEGFTYNMWVNMTKSGPAMGAYQYRAGGTTQVYFQPDSTNMRFLLKSHGVVIGDVYTGYSPTNGFKRDGTEWGMATVTCNTASNTGKMYKNGLEVTVYATDYCNVSQIQNEGEVSIRIGLSGSTSFYGGEMDNVMFLPYELTDAEVLSLYNGTESTNPNPFGSYTKEPGDFSSFVFYNSTSTYWNTTLNIADSDGSTPSILEDESLVSYWRLDENYLDSKGINNGTPTGTQNATGISSGAMYFDGTNDFINTTDIDEIDGATYLTISAWIRPEALSDWDGIVQKYQDGNNRITLQISGTGQGTNNDFGLTTASGAAAVAEYTTGNYLSTGTWTHIVATYDGTKGATARTTLYVNGELATSAGSTSSLPTTSNHVIIGNDQQGAGRFFNGSIDEVLIYNKTLIAEEAKIYTKQDYLNMQMQT